MTDAAVIFDVDGVLLELTADEENFSFDAFAEHLDPARLSRDWNSYRIRNDDDIIDEILEMHGLSPSLNQPSSTRYLTSLHHSLNTQQIVSTPISGAASSVG